MKYCSKVEGRIDGPWTNVPGLTFRKTIRDPLAGKTLYAWQQEILNLIKTEPDDRTINWFWDRNGRTGKTTLGKHITMNYNALFVNGKANDICCAAATILEERDIDIVIFGLTRSDEARLSYRALESLKDGIFFSGKYESRQCIFNPPHIIVFANFAPNLGALSADRWNIFEITDSRETPIGTAVDSSSPCGGGGSSLRRLKQGTTGEFFILSLRLVSCVFEI